MSSAAEVDALTGRLRANPSDPVTLVELARLGTSAQSAAPLILEIFQTAADPYLRAHCLDVVARILEDVESPHATTAAQVLGQALGDPKYHGMRPKVARTLRHIGYASRVAIPGLARALQVARSSLRVPARRALIWLTWHCWCSHSPDDQELVFAALPPFTRSQRIFYLNWLLHEWPEGGSAIRARAALLRDELLAKQRADQARK